MEDSFSCVFCQRAYSLGVCFMCSKGVQCPNYSFLGHIKVPWWKESVLHGCETYSSVMQCIRVSRRCARRPFLRSGPFARAMDQNSDAKFFSTFSMLKNFACGFKVPSVTGVVMIAQIRNFRSKEVYRMRIAGLYGKLLCVVISLTNHYDIGM